MYELITIWIILLRTSFVSVNYAINVALIHFEIFEFPRET